MGQCYSVELSANVKDEENLLKALRGSNRANLAELYSDCKTFEDVMNVLLRKEDKYSDFSIAYADPEYGKNCYRCDFEASYGWETVIADTFKEIAPFLEEGSDIFVNPDTDFYRFEVRNGKAEEAPYTDRSEFENLAYELYKKDWTESHIDRDEAWAKFLEYQKEKLYGMEDGMSFDEWLYENDGYDGVLFACKEEFLESEYLDKEYMKGLLGNEPYLYQEYEMHMNDREVSQDKDDIERE